VTAADRAIRAAQVLERSRAYPAMAKGACYESALILAAVFPELRYVEGKRTMEITDHTGTVLGRAEISHGWNKVADGTIIDSTLCLDGVPAAQVRLSYREGVTARDSLSALRELRQVVRHDGRTRGERWRAARRLARELEAEVAAERATVEHPSTWAGYWGLGADGAPERQELPAGFRRAES